MRSGNNVGGLRETYRNPLVVSKGRGSSTCPHVHSRFLDFIKTLGSTGIFGYTIADPRLALLMEEAQNHLGFFPSFAHQCCFDFQIFISLLC